MGAHDHSSLLETFHTGTPERLTHWIIALEGQPEEGRENHIIWRLFVFPADADGIFNYEHAFFSSAVFPTMEAAWQPAAELAQRAREDQLVTSAAVAATN